MEFILQVILGLFPLLFQMIGGSKLFRFMNLKYFYVCLISIGLWILSAWINLTWIGHMIVHSGSNDGLPTVGMLALETFIAALILLTIIIQVIIRYFISYRTKKLENVSH